LSEQRKAGETIAGAMRRIGHRHAVITPAVKVELVDIERVRAELARVEEIIGKATTQLAQLRAQRTLLEQRIGEFDAATIDRIEGDPDVPLEAPKVEPAVDANAAAERPRGRAPGAPGST
jgi:anti-sigma factor ChrR (cupin superfamily)